MDLLYADGRLWLAFRKNDGPVQLWSSDDDGATWTHRGDVG